MALMRSGPVIRMFALLLVLTWGVVTLSRLPAQTAPPTDELTKAQIENQRAQATYYQRQADKRGFWRNVREYGGPIGATVAAVVAIVSFSLNYSATLRSRADVRFYESLNLLGDRDNPTVRSTAAGLLEQMASTKKRYFETAFDQLCVGLLSEQHENARNSIRASLGRLIGKDPVTALAKLEAFNRTLRDSLAESLCRFYVARGMKSIEQMPEVIWEEIEEVTTYDRQALTGLLETLPKDNLVADLNSAIRSFRTLGESDYDAGRAKTRIESGEAAERLRSNIKSISESLFYSNRGSQGFLGRIFRKNTFRSFSSTFLAGAEFRDLESFRICRAVLRNANMASANLKRASLLEADLSNADLSHAKLSSINCKGTRLTGAILKNADLSGAKIQNTDLSGVDLSDAIFRGTVIAPGALQGTKWWRADFRHQRSLLKVVYTNLKTELPDLEYLYLRGEIHQSVLDFIGKVTEERL